MITDHTGVMIPEILDPIKRILDLVSPQRHVVKGYKYCASAVVCGYCFAISRRNETRKQLVL
jgi:hypothetical protein